MKAALGKPAARRVALWGAVALAALYAFLYSQGRGITGGPSEATAMQAIEESLRKQVPTMVAKSVYASRAVDVYRVAILDVGGSVSRGGIKAWAVRAHVMGKLESQEAFRKSSKDFEGEGTWLVSRDPLGTWAAVAAEY